MKPFSSSSKAGITQLGAIARSCLTPGTSGKVLAAFSKAIYLVTDTSELFWLATEHASLHRRCALIPKALSNLTAGAPFYVDEHRLVLDSDFILEIKDSSIWDEPRIDPGRVVTGAKLSGRVQTLFSTLDLSQAKGFGNFIPHLLSLSNSSLPKPEPEYSDSVLHFSKPYILEIAHACLENDPSRVPQNTNALIGLGPGLTPSGDDFVGGMLFALKTLQAAYPNSNFHQFVIPVESYASQTNFISHTLMSDLASGHAIAPLHHIVNGLLSGEAFENILLSVSNLTQVGHSTGWDLLAGLLTGLLITCRSNVR